MYQYLGQVLRNDELRIPPRKSPSIYPSGKRWVVPSPFTGSNHPAWGVNRKLFTTTEKSREGDEFRSVAFLHMVSIINRAGSIRTFSAPLFTQRSEACYAVA